MELERSLLFRGLPGEVTQEIKRRAKLRSYTSGEILFYEGDPASHIQVLSTGRVELTYTLPQDTTMEIRIAHIEPGENFAWSALTSGQTLSSQARALVDSTAFLIPAEDLHAVFLDHPVAGYDVMRRFAGQVLTRLRETRRELRWLHQAAR